LSGDGTSEDTGEEEFTQLPGETDIFAASEQQLFSELIPQDARDFFEKEASSSDLTNNLEVDMTFSQLNSSMAFPSAGISPVEFISEPMRSDL
jgi:hypothetical protein